MAKYKLTNILYSLLPIKFKTICLQGSQSIDIILDAPGSAEIERRCHFGDGEILKYATVHVCI